MAKYERILSFFPAYYRAGDRTKLLVEVVKQLTQPLEEADTHLFRIRRSHRVQVAEQVEDLLLLAGSLNLGAYDFEDILRDTGMTYGQKLVLMRQRIQRIARVHLSGLGTPWAVMESTAIYMNAAIVPGEKNDPLIKPVDQEGYSYKAFIEFSHLPGKPRSPIYLHENPLRRKKIELAERYPMNSWTVKNENVTGSPVRLVIKGLGERTVLPGIFCPQTGEGLVFNGMVPEGKTLIIDESSGALLDRQPVDEWIIYYKGGIFDHSKISGSETVFVEEQGSIDRPFDGSVENLESRPYQKKKTVPKVPVGSTDWYFNTAGGVYDGTQYDFSRYDIDHEPIGEYDGNYEYDECVYDHPASALVGMAWDERIPCTFKLVLPPGIPMAESGQGGSEAEPVDYTGRIGSILPRYKAAGIQCFVDKAKDGWILGTGIIRNLEAHKGEGITAHAARLYGQKTDLFVETYN